MIAQAQTIEQAANWLGVNYPTSRSGYDDQVAASMCEAITSAADLEAGREWMEANGVRWGVRNRVDIAAAMLALIAFNPGVVSLGGAMLHVRAMLPGSTNVERVERVETLHRIVSHLIADDLLVVGARDAWPASEPLNLTWRGADAARALGIL